MTKKPITEVLAENLAYYMGQRSMTQQTLAQRAGVGQTTVSLYLRPKARKDTHEGGAPSPTLARVQALADALGVELWELVRPLSPVRRDLLRTFEHMVAEEAARYAAPAAEPAQESTAKARPGRRKPLRHAA